MHRNLDEVEFTIFDTETTGLNPAAGDRIVEIAAIRFKGKEKLGEFQALVNPQREISWGAFQVNKITPEDLLDAPLSKDILPGFLDFIQGSCLCSYNAPFDLGFLYSELKLMNTTLPPETMVVDILTMAKKLLPNLERYALWFIAETLGIKSEQKHRALSDAGITLEVFNKLKMILDTKKIHDFQNFLRLFTPYSSFRDSMNNRRIAEVQEAINLGVKLKIRYFSNSNAEVSDREVIPKLIKQDKNHSCLVGYCCLRQEERTFRIDGILHLEIL